MTTTQRQGEMMRPGVLGSEECLSNWSVSSKFWLVSDDENFHLPNSESDEPCLSK
jgi:hypothetical protein